MSPLLESVWQRLIAHSRAESLRSRRGVQRRHCERRHPSDPHFGAEFSLLCFSQGLGDGGAIIHGCLSKLGSLFGYLNIRCRTIIGTRKGTIILRNHPHYTCFVDFCWEGLRFSDLRALGFGVWGSGCKVWGISVFQPHESLSKRCVKLCKCYENLKLQTLPCIISSVVQVLLA